MITELIYLIKGLQAKINMIRLYADEFATQNDIIIDILNGTNITGRNLYPRILTILKLIDQSKVGNRKLRLLVQKAIENFEKKVLLTPHEKSNCVQLYNLILRYYPESVPFEQRC